jgi:hypothetical protein
MGQSVRSLAVEAGITVRECAHRLGRAGIEAAVGGRRLDGHELTAARTALGPMRHRSAGPTEDVGRELDGGTMIIRLLRPPRGKGEVGREHTTAIEHVHGHGIPDHLKAEAKRLVEKLLVEDCLAEKVSQRRRHVWLTVEGRARLLHAEASGHEDGRWA